MLEMKIFNLARAKKYTEYSNNKNKNSCKKRSDNIMILEDIWKLLKKTIFLVPSTNTYFNHYKDIASDLDLPDAEKIRRSNLRNYLQSHPERPSILLIGIAPGYNGCRFSGVPFTSEAQLCNRTLPFRGERSSRKDSPRNENTATSFWKVMSRYHPKFIAWNCFPFHPHLPSNRLSNRPPKRQEIDRFLKTLEEMISLLNPNIIVAVGRKPERALKRMDHDTVYVRHPARGGSKKFKEGITQIFSKHDTNT